MRLKRHKMRISVNLKQHGPPTEAEAREAAGIQPLPPPPEPPAKLYEDDDFDLYADIETPHPSSKLAPPPEPPALLLTMDGDDKEEGAETDEDAGLVIDDKNDAYDPEMPTSPPSPPPSTAKSGNDENCSEKINSSSLMPTFSLDDIPRPPTPPEKDDDSGSECPNQGLYSKLSMEIAKSDSDNSDIDDLPPPPPPPFGTLDLSTKKGTQKAFEPVEDDSPEEQEVPENLSMAKCDLQEKEVESESGKVDEKVDDEDEVELEKESVEKDEIPKPKARPNDAELSEGELEDLTDDEKDDSDPKIGNDDGDSDDSERSTRDEKGKSPREDSDTPSAAVEKPISSSPTNDKVKDLLAVLNGTDDSSAKEEDKVKDGERETEGENDLLELGCEEERDGLVDITDEEISNYERSWELEESGKNGKVGLDGLETEAISDCEYPPGDGEEKEKDKEKDLGELPKLDDPEGGEGNKSEEGEIVGDDRDKSRNSSPPVQWKKLSKGTKERSYRGEKESSSKSKEISKEITKRKEKRKELERYDVRKLISEKPRRKVDEFGRDISSHSRSNSRSPSRGRRSTSRTRRRRTKSRSRSRERLRSKERVKERSRERSRDRSRSKDKVRRERSKERKSRSRSKKRRRSRTPRKDGGRSRDKGSRERKKRKKSPSMSCSSCSCSSCEREKRRSKKLTVTVVTNEDVNKNKEKKRKNKDKKAASPKSSRRRTSPVPSKEVFTSGDNILVSVNFKSSKSSEGTRSKDVAPSSKRRKDDEPRKKKDKGTKENQPMRSIVTAKKSSKKKQLNSSTKNMKPIAIIDLDASPFRETIMSPKEIIILTDSDSEDKMPPAENPPVLMTGPKTPPEPLIKFNIVNNKQQQIRTMSNPLMDSLMEQLEGEGDDEPEEIIHKGPNTPPEPPVPYDPFEPTKSRSPTPCPDGPDHHTPPQENNQRHSPAQSQPSQTPPVKLPQHVAPKTPSPLHSPPKPTDEPTDKPKLLPFQPAGMDSGDDSPGGGGGGGDSPYSPGSSEGDDLFEPPLPQPGAAAKPKARPPLQPPVANKHVLAPKPLPIPASKKRTKVHKENKKGSSKKEIGIKLDEDQLKILDELPNSAVEMQVKDKFLKKLNRQERVVEEVKMVLKPHYAKKHVTKEEYKEILRKAVPKICHSRSGEINPMKIQRLIEAYVKKYRHKSKKRGGAPAIPPLRQNKAQSKTMWC